MMKEGSDTPTVAKSAPQNPAGEVAHVGGGVDCDGAGYDHIKCVEIRQLRHGDAELGRFGHDHGHHGIAAAKPATPMMKNV